MTLFEHELNALSGEARKIQMAFDSQDDDISDDRFKVVNDKFKVDDITYTYIDTICEPAIARGVTKVATQMAWRVDRLPGITFHYYASCGVQAIRQGRRVPIISAREFDLFGKSFGDAALAVAGLMRDVEPLLDQKLL